ncbi:hypothetical protein [Mucilaginibacter endophyticus]|uniref:hypothetical protein n=1 Tax=Mucilaginibacter endophyticus TaxID=2675003 RepID=UPI0012B173F8|nr:hypothetical protein [Mucilaginibacter endophyticus]
MINIGTVDLLRDDGSTLTLTIEPQFEDGPEGRYFTHVYDISKTTIDQPGEVCQVAFKIDEQFDWEFCGGEFSVAEQEQIVDYIHKHEPIDSFAFEITSEGKQYHIRVTDNEGHFGIELNGKFAAVIQHWEDWEQSEGETLPSDIFDQIVNKIESHYD